jgi:hypothetical protein
VTPSLAVLGFFDVPSFGDLLIPRIVQSEVVRRCPLAAIRAYAPLGRRHPVPLDGGHLAEPLDPPTPSRARGIVDEHDLVLLGWPVDQPDPRGLGLYSGAADRTTPSGPSDWFAGRDGLTVPADYPVVRLAEHGGGDAVLLVDRVIAAPARARRLLHLQALGRWPAETPVVIDTDAMAPHGRAVTMAVVSALLEAAAWRAFVAVDHQERPEPLPIDSLMPAAGRPATCRVPALHLDDVAAAVSGAGVVVAGSVSMALTALSFDVPVLFIQPSAPMGLVALARRAGLESVVVADPAGARNAVATVLSSTHRGAMTLARSRLLRDLDACFDSIVELMLASWERRTARAGARGLLALATRFHAEAMSLGTAHEARGLQLAEARTRLVELTDNALPSPERSRP